MDFKKPFVDIVLRKAFTDERHQFTLLLAATTPPGGDQ